MFLVPKLLKELSIYSLGKKNFVLMVWDEIFLSLRAKNIRFNNSVIKKELLKKTNENEIHANFGDQHNILVMLISSLARPICNHSC